MADLFSRTEVDFGGAMTSQFGLIVPTKGLTGVLMQNISLTYQQQVTRLYEIGRAGAPVGGSGVGPVQQIKTKVYYISGRASGQLQASHIIGPGVTMKEFYDNFSDVCQAGTNNLRISLGSNRCSTSLAAELTYTAKFCVLTSVGMSVAAQEFVVNEQSSLMFSGLELVANNP